MNSSVDSEIEAEPTVSQTSKRRLGLGLVVFVLALVAALAVIRMNTQAQMTLHERLAADAEAVLKDSFRSEYRQEPLFLKLGKFQGFSGSGHERGTHPEEGDYTLKIPRIGTFENGTIPVNIYIGNGEEVYVRRIDCWDGGLPDHPRIDVCVMHPAYD